MSSASLPNDSPTDGEAGPIWTSVNGGGLGKRGELDGETAAAAMAGWMKVMDDDVVVVDVDKIKQAAAENR